MWLSEQVLYRLAKRFCRTEVAHSREMTEALSNRQNYDEYRFGQVDQILRHAEELGIDISGKTLLDLGCSDGAITVGYKQRGAKRVVGVDIDPHAIERAKKRDCDGVSFRLGGVNSIPWDDETFDLVICYDVFEHVSDPAAMLDQCHRVMKPRAKMLIGTWGWYHPFAPHMWAVMPVPWAHVFVSERTFLQACRRVYQSPWYRPNMFDLDETGKKKDKYDREDIPREYVNKLLIRDYCKVFRQSAFDFELFPKPFGSRLASWTRIFLHTPWLREFVTGYLWVVLTKREGPDAPQRQS